MPFITPSKHETALHLVIEKHLKYMNETGHNNFSHQRKCI